MSIQINEVPPRQVIHAEKSMNLTENQKLKLVIDDEIFEDFEFEVPEGKVAHLRIEIRGSLSDET